MFCSRALKCVFLGYSRLQKGYQCYSPETKKYYMSANVTFFEQTPYFSSSVQDAHVIQQVLPLIVVESPISDVSINPSPNQSPPEPHPHLLIPSRVPASNTVLRRIVQLSKNVVNPRLQILLLRLLLPCLLMKVIPVGPLLSKEGCWLSMGICS